MPRFSIRLAATAAFCALPLVGFAQMSSAPQPASPMPGSAESAPPATSANTGTKADTSATVGLKTGMMVKDSTGATVGKISKIASDTATIKMSKGSFSAPTSSLTVEKGAATINMTKADIDAQVQSSSKKPS
jgi:hypothetical protein